MTETVFGGALNSTPSLAVCLCICFLISELVLPLISGFFKIMFFFCKLSSAFIVAMEDCCTVAGSGRFTSRHSWRVGSHGPTTRSQVHVGHATQWQPWVESAFPSSLPLWSALLPTGWSTACCLLRSGWDRTPDSVQWLPAISKRSLGHRCAFW